MDLARRPQLRFNSEAARSGVVLAIEAGNQLRVESGRSEVVHLVVECLRIEDLARLLSNCLLKVVVILS